MSSLSRAVVFRISGLIKHENADSLMKGEFEGCPFIVNMNDTHEGDLRIFVPFDMITPDEEWVGWVRNQRIRPVRLRGVFSMAVCLPLPPGEFSEGEDVTERLGFTKWEPPEERETPDGVQLKNTKSGPTVKGPSYFIPKYDLESLRKYHGEFIEGERVIIQEKIEGENIAVVFDDDGKMHVRSRNYWKGESDNKWWQAVGKYNWEWLRNYPGLVAFGEKYGNVNKFRYDCVAGEEKIRLFDLYDSNVGRFLDWRDFVSKTVFGNTSYAPVLYDGPWLGLDAHKGLAEGKSTFGDNIREGFTVRPVNERTYNRFDRLYLKYHGESYLTYKGKIK